jgi:hypothetical protein
VEARSEGVAGVKAGVEAEVEAEVEAVVSDGDPNRTKRFGLFSTPPVPALATSNGAKISCCGRGPAGTINPFPIC